MKRFVLVTAIALVLGFSTFAHAALIDNGNNLIYDTALNITWYDPVPTLMNWSQATAWAAGLTVGGTQAGSWSLPTILPVHGSTYNYDFSYDGSSDIGYNISAPGSAYPGSTGSELAFLYYVDLVNKGAYDVNGTLQAGGLYTKGPLTNLYRGYVYWSGSQVLVPGWSGWARAFDMFDGDQSYYDKSSDLAGLAVHAGDVPCPGAIFLFAPGLLGLAVLRRRFKE